MRKRRIVMLVLAASWAASIQAQGDRSSATVCPGGPSTYQGKTVVDVRLTSPIDFIQAVRVLEERAKQALPLREGDRFDAREYSHGTNVLATAIRSRFPSALVSFRLVAVLARLENCTAESVVIHYQVFTAVIPRSSANLAEIARALTARPSGTAGALSTNGAISLLPNVNYNHTRRLFGGLMINQSLPLKIFDHIEADPAASGNSTTGTIKLTGSTNPAKTYLNRVNWQLGNEYYDVPVNEASVTKGLLSAEGFVSTKELARAFTLRAGGEVGGGHVQDGTGVSASSSYGEVKFLCGMVARGDNKSGSVSYGLEVGRSISSAAGTFEKHIFDARFEWTFERLPTYVKSGEKREDDRVKFIGTPHHPLSVEVQANGGILTGSSAVPSVERFFGGNQTRLFIPGQPWDALAQPYIRSISENRLGATTGSNVVGGDRFYSANLTIARAVWGKALVPRSLASQDFLEHLDFGINTSKGELSDIYYSKDSGVADVAGAVGTMGDVLAALKRVIAALPPGITGSSNVKPNMKDLAANLTGALMGVKSIQAGHANVMPRLLNTSVPALEGDLGGLSNAAKAAGDATSAEAIEHSRTALDQELTTLKSKWDNLDTNAARAKADAHAAADFAPAETVLNRLLYTLNSYSIAPVGIFDVARVWPEERGTRYGVGAGARLSIVNANFTFGFAYNPTHVSHEGAGAVFFKLDFTDIFR